MRRELRFAASVLDAAVRGEKVDFAHALRGIELALQKTLAED